MANTISIDAGGTFTDGYITRGDEYRSVKVPTTPHDLTECFFNCIEKGAESFETDVATLLAETEVLRLATTVGTNAIIERTGPKLGAIVTAGHEETLYGDEPIDIPFVDSDMIVGVDERVDEMGTVVTPVEEDEILAQVRRLVDGGARIIVIALQNAALNDANERTIAGAIEERYPQHYLRSVPIQLSTQVTDLPDDRRRTTAVLVNSYLHPELAKHLYKAEDRVRDQGYARPLLAVHSDGGTSRIAKTKAINTYSSGPSAGLVGTTNIASLYGFDSVLTADMGGTSVDAGLVTNGQYTFETTPAIEGIEVAVPMLQMNSIGAGGGSIASVDAGDLRVGPESASARPGPACYGLGGEDPTVTDADVVLGYINPDYFLGGEQRLDAEAAHEAIRSTVADPLGTDVETAALRVRERVDETIGSRLAALVEDRGVDVRSIETLFSFGGAGPLHACGFAEVIDVDTVVTFPFGSVFNSYGAGTMDLVHRYTESVNDRVASTDSATIDAVLDGLEARARRDIQGEGLDPDEITFSTDVVACHDGGPRQLLTANESSTTRELLESAGQSYVERTKLDGTSTDVTIEAVQLNATVDLPDPVHPTYELGKPDPNRARKGERPVYWAADPTTTPVYDYDALEPGMEIRGPAIIESTDSTYAIPDAWRFVVNGYGHGILVTGYAASEAVPGTEEV